MNSSQWKKLVALAALILTQWAVLAYAEPVETDEAPVTMTAPADNSPRTVRIGEGSSEYSNVIGLPDNAPQVYIRSAPGDSSYPNATAPFTYIQQGYRY